MERVKKNRPQTEKNSAFKAAVSDQFHIGPCKVMLFTQKRVKAQNFLRLRDNSDKEALAEFERVGFCCESGS